MAGYHDCVTYIKASDLQKIADELYIDGLEYVRLTIRYDDDSEFLDGSVHISGIKNFEDTKFAKHYKFIESANLPHLYE